MISLQKLDHIALQVKDLQKSIDWYTRVLGLERWENPDWGEVPVFMLTTNKTGIALFPSAAGNPLPDEVRTIHFAFQVEGPGFAEARDHLTGLSVDWGFQDHVASKSIYFRDPDNYLLEITTYDLR